MQEKNDIDPEVIRQLESLKEIPERDAHKAEEGRAAFMKAAEKEFEGVSPLPVKRHNHWMKSIRSKETIQRKEQSPMFNFVTTILIALSLLLGGGGVTVAAAQSSLPDQTLYGVKLLSEDVRLKMTNDPEAQFQLAMDYAQRRAAEIQTMLQSGNVPDEALQTRYQAQVEEALQYALKLPDSRAIQALQQIQTRLQEQNQALIKVQTNGSPAAEAALLRNRQMIQEHLQWVQGGLSDPEKFKQQMQNRAGQDENPASETEPATQVPADTGAGNPWTTGTPTPLSGYGPGPGLSTTATPEGFYGPGPHPTAIPGHDGNH